eukprot:3559090-Amphidinium_carterae.3
MFAVCPTTSTESNSRRHGQRSHGSLIEGSWLRFRAIATVCWTRLPTGSFNFICKSLTEKGFAKHSSTLRVLEDFLETTVAADP